MPPTLTRRKPAWTVDQWRVFGLRCQAVRDRLDAFIADFPPTLGLKVEHARPIFRAYDKLGDAMLRAERVMGLQHPGHDVPVVAIIHGPEGMRSRLGPIGVVKGPEIVSRERWAALGHAAKAIRADLRALVFLP